MNVINNNEIIFNRYRILDKYGEGEMGEVYKIKDIEKNIILALKLLKNKNDSELIKDFKKEYLMMSSLENPFFCRAFEFFKFKEHYMFIMEFFEGLDIIKASKNLDFEQKIQLIVKVLRGLAYIHSQGIIHFDIKPENILVNNEALKIMDLGLSSFKRRTIEKKIKGTPQYISPEIINNENVDIRTDLYSLGVIIFEIFTGRNPFSNKTVEEIIKEKIEKRVEFTEEEKQKIPKELRSIILKLLQRMPSDRYLNAYEVMHELKQFIGESTEFNLGELYYEDIVSENYCQFEDISKIKNEIFINRTNFILIQGEKGVGKSTLIRVIKKFLKMEEVEFIEVSCNLSKMSAFALLNHLLGNIIASGENERKDLIERFADSLYQIFPLIKNKGYLKNRIFATPPKNQYFDDILNFLLEFYKSREKVIFIIENLQWCDPESLEILQYIIENLIGSKILFLATIRSEFQSCPSYIIDFLNRLKIKNLSSTFTLENFSLEKTKYFLSKSFPECKKLDELSEKVYSKTNGNPMYIKLLLKKLLKDGIISYEQGRIDIGDIDFDKINFTVELNDSLKELINKLSEPQLKIMKICAISNGKLPFDIIKYVGNMESDELKKELSFLLEKKLILEEIIDGIASYYISQLELKELIFRNISEKELVNLYFELGSTFEKVYCENLHNYAEDVAEYFLKGQNFKKAFDYFKIAAENARKKYLPNRAISNFRKCIDIYKNNQDLFRPDDSVEVYLKLGSTFELEGEYGKAYDVYSEFVEVAKTLNDKKLLADAYENLGIVSWRLGNFQDSIKFHKMSLEIWENLKDDGKIARNLSFIGSVYWTMGENNKALDYYTKSLPVFKKIKDRIRYAGICHNIGLVYYNLGETEKAYIYLKKSLRIFKKQKDKRSIARNLHTLSSVYYVPNLLIRKALRGYKTAMKYFEEVGDTQGIAACLRDIGGILSSQCRFNDAIDTLKKALTLFESIGEKRGILTTYIALGEVYSTTQTYQQGLNYFKESVELSNKINERHMFLIAQNNLANILREIGDIKKAEELHLECFEYIKKFGLGKFESNVLIGYGSDLFYAGDFSKAENYLRQGLETAIKNNDTSLKIYAYSLLSELYLNSGNIDEGIYNLNKMFEHLEKTSNNVFLVKAYLIKSLLPDTTDKKECLENARLIAKKMNLKDSLFEIYTYLGNYYLEKRYYKNAFDCCKKAIIYLEEMCNEIEDEGLKIKFLKNPKRKLVFEIVNKLKDLLEENFK